MARATRSLTVHTKTPLSPNLMRVVLAGDALEDFPTGFEGGYVKLVLPTAEGQAVRSYTIREFLPSVPELVLDMVSHGDNGPAAHWVNRVAIGDDVSIVGPGACQRVNRDADWFLLAGDMSALPAISVNLETLPHDAKGHVFLEIMEESDKPELKVPSGIDIHWVINPEPDSPNSMLEDHVMALPWQPGRVSVWVAGEFSASRALRQYFRHEREVERDLMYVSCYWKIGTTDEGMKAAKKADPEPW